MTTKLPHLIKHLRLETVVIVDAGATLHRLDADEAGLRGRRRVREVHRKDVGEEVDLRGNGRAAGG